MEPKFQSSFIPKGPITTPGVFKASKSRSLLDLASVFIFSLAVILALGVFGYERYLLSRIGTMGEELVAARTTIKPDTVRELMRMDARIHSTGGLLERHSAITPIFDFLEENTLENVRFTAFNFATTDKGIVLGMKGQARGYQAVALQSEMFNRNKFIMNPAFSDLDLDREGNVTFSFTSIIDPSFISYERQIGGGSVAPAAPFVPESTSATSTSTSTPQ